MGYTVATPIRDQATKKKLVAFFREHWREWPVLEGKEEGSPQYYRGPLPDGLPKDRSLSYDHGPCRIGFDFNTAAYEREYIFAACRWMALRAGKLYTFPTKVQPHAKGQFPVIVYDGDEATDPGDGEGPWPVILEGTRVPPKLDWCVVDKWGCKTKIRKVEEDFNRMLCGYDGWEIIRKELQRLDSLWQP